MEAEPVIDIAIEKIRKAVEKHGKLKLATKADISESSIRGADRPGWNPTGDTLRKLEIAAAELDAEAGVDTSGLHGGSAGQISRATVIE